MATTTIVLDTQSRSIKSMVCHGCASYADSIIYLTDTACSAEEGWCIHTSCADCVVQAIQPTTVTPLSSFSTFISSQIACDQAVTTLNATKNTKYLVFSDPDKAFECGVGSYSICVIRSVNSKKFLTCRDVRCKKRKRKKNGEHHSYVSGLLSSPRAAQASEVIV